LAQKSLVGVKPGIHAERIELGLLDPPEAVLNKVASAVRVASVDPFLLPASASRGVAESPPGKSRGEAPLHAWAQGQGAHARVNVNFATEGAKWLVVSMAKLESV
jgi:DNA helicase-2/ATP-dependent DNA helicase PcrA